ncbi:MAG: AAA family ATPase [Puniceicoccales bacterium]|jgi:general secretion pathway protein A|nr:AAA family ATPase [Puniceicoccales bacterium]
MYLKYFALKKAPFGIATNPDYLYLSSQHGEALAHLRYGIENRRGLIVLTGEVGCGKTTLSQALLRKLPDEKYRKITLINSLHNALDLYSFILNELQQDHQPGTLPILINRVSNAIQSVRNDGSEIIITIDEAQNFSVNMLEQIRLLLNLENDDQRTMQILLIGQPELKSLLKRKELRQLKQRIGVFYDLRPLKFHETIKYVDYRLVHAGSTGAIRFTLPALFFLHRASSGIPRILNALCDRAMLACYIRGGRSINYGDARHAIGDLRRL